MSNAETSLQQNLKLLAIFHYVVAGFAALFSMFPLIHLGLGIAMVLGKLPESQGQDATVAGWFFIVFAAIFILLGLTFAVLILITGRKIAKRRSHLFCLVVAGIECLFMPFGTVLGIFTLITLTKPEAKALFETPR